MSRPTPSSQTTTRKTDAKNAAAYGASRCGAGMSSTTSSVRAGSASTNARMVSTARWNGSGGRASRGVIGPPGDPPDARPRWGDGDACAGAVLSGHGAYDHRHLGSVADHDRQAADRAHQVGAVDAVAVGARRLLEDAVVVTAGTVACEGHPLTASLSASGWGLHTLAWRPARSRDVARCVPKILITDARPLSPRGVRGPGPACGRSWDHPSVPDVQNPQNGAAPRPANGAPAAAEGRANLPAARRDGAFLAACRRLPVPHTPVWFMRQAGRSLPEYREARGTVPMLEACPLPELIGEITMQPVRRYAVAA